MKECLAAAAYIRPRHVIGKKHHHTFKHSHLQYTHSRFKTTNNQYFLFAKSLNPSERFKMRFSGVSTAAALSILSGANAIITGITAPATIAPGQPFIITLNTANYIQAVYNVAAAFGIADGKGYPQSLGTVIDSEYLGPSKSNILDPINFTVQIDADTPTGPHLLSAAVFSLYGAVAGPGTDYYNVTVTVGSETSTETVTSKSS
jgi:hypothetical protein